MCVCLCLCVCVYMRKCEGFLYFNVALSVENVLYLRKRIYKQYNIVTKFTYYG